MRVGIDMTSVKRVTELKSKDKILNPDELKMTPESQAGAIAAKEALAKALGIVPPPWLEIELKHNKDGSPYLELSKKLRNKTKEVSLSITHESGLAVAVVVSQ